MAIKTFSEEISTKDKKAYDEFVQKVYTFLGRYEKPKIVHWGQSSGIIGTHMVTHHTAIVEYEINGS